MKLLITKFIKDPTYTNQYLPDNYFTCDGIDVIDFITITRIPPQGIPVFNEELTKPGEPMQLKCGDYDVKLSLLDDTISNLGKSLHEFFSLDKKYIVRVMVQNNNELKSFGFIDISSIKFDLNISGNAFTVSFTVYSGELEWHNYASGKKFGDFGYINQGRHETWDENDLSFGAFMDYLLNDTNVVLDDRSNIDLTVLQKCGFMLKTSPLQKVFVNASYWQVFKDIMAGFGLTYKIVPNETYCSIDRWGKPNLILFYRNDGLGINPIKVIERLDGYSANNDYETYMMLYSKYLNSPGVFAKFEGFINNTDQRVSGGIYCFRIDDVFNLCRGWNVWFYRNGVQENIFRDKNCVMDAGLNLISWSYDGFGKWGDGNDERNYASAARFFVRSYSYVKPLYSPHYLYSDDGFQQIVESILPHVYDFLIVSLKKSLILKIVNNDLFDSSIYNKMNFKGTDYWIERVFDTDLYERTAKIKLIEK